MSVLWEDVRARRAAHAEAFLTRVAEEAGDDLRARVSENEALELLLLQGVEIVVRSGLPAKREHLARVVGQALKDDAKVSEAYLLARAYEVLDEFELLALARLGESQLSMEAEVGIPDLESQGVDEYNRRSEAIGEAVSSRGAQEPVAVLASLIAAGVVWPVGPLGGGVMVSRVSDFGLNLLDDLDAVSRWR